MPKKTKKEGFIFDVPKDDPSLALEDDDYFEEGEEEEMSEEEEEEEIKGVPKGFNFENLRGIDDDEDDEDEKMLKKLLDEEYNESITKKKSSSTKKKSHKKFDDDEEDDDVLLGLKDAEEEEEENNEMEEEEEEEGLSFDTLNALDDALTIEKQKKKSKKITEKLQKISEQIDIDSSVGTVPSDAPSYPNARRIGKYQIVDTRKTATRLSDRGPSSDVKNFLNSRLYGRNVQRMPAHVVVKNGAHSAEAIGTKYKVKASNLKVQKLHIAAAHNGKISNPKAARSHLYPKRR